jgi:hypothetical protein
VASVKRLQVAVVVSIGIILVLTVAAAVLRPWLPWLFAVFVMAGLFRVFGRR